VKRALIVVLGVAIVAAGIVAAKSLRKQLPVPPPTQTAGSMAEPAQVPPSPIGATPAPAQTSAPAEWLPEGWKDFRAWSDGERLNRVTAVMTNRTLPPDVLTLFEQEIANRRHPDLTRNNMANALVWQENPNPRLHELFIKMLEDRTENPVWRDYCLQFLSESLKSTSEPEAVKAVLARYAKGKDALAGTAIVHLAYQESRGALQLDEAFSRQVEAQLTDPEVSSVTKMSILGVIGQRRDTRLLPVVRTCAGTSLDDGLRRCALAALGQIGVAEDLPLIQAATTHSNRAVQLAAQSATERLKARLASKSP